MDRPYWDLVPRDIDKNLAFRQEVIREGLASRRGAEECWQMCKRDVLFYMGTFCYTYDPRPGKGILPFIPWDYEVDLMARLVEAIETGHDLVVEKSRDMGVTWCALVAFEHYWHFGDMTAFLLVSRKEELVDKRGDPSCLFWKLDFLHRNQPPWLLPAARVRTQLHLENGDTGSTINGEATTGDVAAGKRFRAGVFDEFARVTEGPRVLDATADAMPCRIFVSTPVGRNNSFYDLAHNGTTAKVTIHWSLHPEKSAGLYLDGTGKPRSPWYDAECARRNNPTEIAQNLDIDYAGSVFRWFDQAMLDAYTAEMAAPPYWRGEMDEEGVLREGKDGSLALWLNMGKDGTPPTSRYVIGGDVSAGAGQSNSCLSIVDAVLREKVGEYASPTVRPEQFGEIAMRIARRFNEALLIWEGGGPGRAFGDRVLDLGYRHVYYATREDTLSRKTSEVPGWHPTKDNKLALFSRYRKALTDREFANRSRIALAECSDYIYTPDGGVAHAHATARIDPSGAKRNHGDRVMADALAWHAVAVVVKPQAVKPAEERPPASNLAQRIQAWETRTRELEGV